MYYIFASTVRFHQRLNIDIFIILHLENDPLLYYFISKAAQ